MKNFEELGLSQGILKSVRAQGYETPTPIQAEAIPLVLAGHDLTGLAQTGTGKTAAFGLPLIHQLLEQNQKPKPKTARSLILAPTRELVNQIADNIRQHVRSTPLWVSLVIGGQSIKSQAKHLARGTDILVATPGRLLDLVNRGAVDLSSVKFLVLDEADQMLDLGFIHALKEISTLVGQPRQTLLFSATMPKAVEGLSRAYQNDPVRVEVSPPGKAADKINQCVHFVSARAKTDLLKQCLTERENDLSLIFHRTKHGAEKLKNHLVECGFKADSIHGNKSQGQRDKAIKGLKAGNIRILVATDVAARGIDIPGISHVYNYNLPEVPENYVHRIGRTARAGESGEAIAFCAPDEFHMLRGIEKLMGISLRVESGDAPQGDAAKPAAKKTRGKSRRKPAGNGFNQRRERTQRESPKRTEKVQDFVEKISRDQPDLLASETQKPRRNRNSQRNRNDQSQPKKFKNKQMSVGEFDALEQKRKDKPEQKRDRSDRPERDGERPRNTQKRDGKPSKFSKSKPKPRTFAKKGKPKQKSRELSS